MARVFCDFIEAFFSRPRSVLRKASREFMESGYPADACGAIRLSFRALVKPSFNIRSTNLEIFHNYELSFYPGLGDAPLCLFSLTPCDKGLTAINYSPNN